MAYKSPIEIIQEEAQMLFEDNVVKAIQPYLISINEDELKMALAYDRDQYEKGYSDGRADREEEIIKCKDCVHRKKLIYEVSEKGNNILKVCELIKLQVNDDFHCGWGEK